MDMILVTKEVGSKLYREHKFHIHATRASKDNVVRAFRVFPIANFLIASETETDSKLTVDHILALKLLPVAAWDHYLSCIGD